MPKHFQRGAGRHGRIWQNMGEMFKAFLIRITHSRINASRQLFKRNVRPFALIQDFLPGLGDCRIFPKELSNFLACQQLFAP